MWLQCSLWPGTTAACSGDELGGKAIDGATEGEVRLETGRKGPFVNMTTVLPLSSRVGHGSHAFSGPGDQSLYPSRVPKRAEWQDRRIIPDGSIVEINQEGFSILLIEQNVKMALTVAQYGFVIESGCIVLEGEAHLLSKNEHVRKSYLG